MCIRDRDATACEACHSKNIKRDPDVLDTWFSSALWPFSTLGWPDRTPDLQYFYPTDVLVTGYDIIFFWVARMIFSGMEQMKREPFHTVLIHGIIRDAQGRKMSKSLGNGVDPIEVINTYGADALRFNIITGNSPGNDMRYYDERCEAMRNFANKIWNASRFVMMYLTAVSYTHLDVYKRQGNGVVTQYMHMSSRSVSVGDSVSQGQQLGISGSTGNSTGPHLHFGVMINGSYVDPLNYLP